MVTEYGMSDRLGLVSYERARQPMFLPESFAPDKNYSEAKAAQIDEEVTRIVEEIHQCVHKILSGHAEVSRKMWQLLDTVPDTELWQTHHWLKVKLIVTIRERTRQPWANGDASTSIMLSGGAFLEPSVLTLGFARRFATYKRAFLIFQDLARLKKHFKDRWRPIQIIFAGKAHPADDPGKRLLQNLINPARDLQLGGRIAFVKECVEKF